MISIFMQRLSKYLVVLALASVWACSSNTETNQWRLVWQDDFLNDGVPDPSKWSFTGRGKADWKCYCTDSPELAFVQNGFLYLKGVVNDNPDDPVPYNTACISTLEKFSFLYGKIEVRAKLSRGKGSWPAIWMMPVNNQYGSWPLSGEIDIMEHLNYDTFVYQTIHTNHTYNLGYKSDPLSHVTAPVISDDFNVYGLEWFPDRLDFYVNEMLTLSYPRLDSADSSQWPFDQPFYIILDQALGGNWVGEVHDEDLPVQMIVDWVKVYQEE